MHARERRHVRCPPASRSLSRGGLNNQSDVKSPPVFLRTCRNTGVRIPTLYIMTTGSAQHGRGLDNHRGLIILLRSARRAARDRRRHGAMPSETRPPGVIACKWVGQKTPRRFLGLVGTWPPWVSSVALACSRSNDFDGSAHLAQAETRYELSRIQWSRVISGPVECRRIFGRGSRPAPTSWWRYHPARSSSRAPLIKRPGATSARARREIASGGWSNRRQWS